MFVLLRALIWSALFIGFVLLYIPARLSSRVGLVRSVDTPFEMGGVIIGSMGAAILYHSWILIGYVAGLLSVTHLFVMFYEEPTLRRLFGGDYVDYCSQVRRWWPKLKPVRGDRA